MATGKEGKELRVEYVPTESLREDEQNAKIHTPEQIEQIKKSIEEFGFLDPIGIWKDGLIVEGHGRLYAAKSLGMEEVPVIRLDSLTEEERKAYALAHNQLTMNTGFEPMKLEEVMAQIETIDMEALGFSKLEPEEIINMEEDEVPEMEESTNIGRGDIFVLGKHRLMCGDSTSQEDFEKLMGG